MSIQSNLDRLRCFFAKVSTEASKADPCSIQIQKTADAIFIKLLEAQDAHPYFQRSGLEAKQLFPLASVVEDISQQPLQEISCHPLLNRLTPEEITDLKTRLKQYPYGNEMNLLDFLGMVISNTCKDDAFRKEFMENFTKFSMSCVAHRCLSRKKNPEEIQALFNQNPKFFCSDAKPLQKLILTWIVAHRSDSEEFNATLTLLNKCITSINFQQNLVSLDEPLKLYFEGSAAPKHLKDFEKNLLWVNDLLKTMKRRDTQYRKKYERLEDCLGRLIRSCSECNEDPSTLLKMMQCYFSFIEEAEGLLVSTHHVKSPDPQKRIQATYEHAFLSSVLNIAAPLFPCVEILYKVVPFTQLLQRIERLINAQKNLFDTCIGEQKNKKLIDTLQQLSVFDEKQLQADFGHQLEFKHEPGLLTLVPSHVSQMCKVQQIVSRLRDQTEYLQDCSRANKVLVSIMKTNTSEDSLASVAQGSYFALSNCLLSSYLLRDIYHLYTHKSQPVVDFIPDAFRNLLQTSMAIDKKFYGMHQSMLANANINPDPAYPDDHDRALILQASEFGLLNILRQAKNIKSDVNFLNKDGSTPLVLAVYKGHIDCVKLLIQSGALVNMLNKDRSSALGHAAAFGKLEILKTLIDAGADLNLKGTNGASALLFAANSGNLDCLKELIKAGANINLQDELGQTAVYCATLSGQSKCLMELIKAGADLNLQDNKGASALICAAGMGKLDCLIELIKAGADLSLKNIKGGSALICAAAEGRLECLKELIKAGADLNLKDKLGYTAVFRTIKRGHLECLKELIKAGANLNLQDDQGYTALMCAAGEGQLGCLEALIKARANLNLQSDQGYTALMCADGERQLDCLEALIKAGANLNLQDEQGYTALMCAAGAGQLDCLESLIKARADLNLQDNLGSTAVVYAIQSGQSKCLIELIKAGADLNLKDALGFTTVFHAIHQGDLESLIELIKARADLNLKDALGFTAVHLAISAGQSKCLIELIKAGADRNLQDNQGMSPLINAVLERNLDCLRALIEARADVNAQCKYGLTPLMYAVEYNDISCAKALIQANADLDRQDNRGFTALVIAKNKGNSDMVLLLSEATLKASSTKQAGEEVLALASKLNELSTREPKNLDQDDKARIAQPVMPLGNEQKHQAGIRGGAEFEELDAQPHPAAAAASSTQQAGEEVLALASKLNELSTQEPQNLDQDYKARRAERGMLGESKRRPPHNEHKHQAGDRGGRKSEEPDTQPHPAAAAAASEKEEEPFNEKEQVLHDEIAQAKNYDVVCKILERYGFVLGRNSGHKIYKLQNKASVIVPSHSRDRPPIGTLRSIADMAIHALRGKKR